jgi:hypothetical protein
MKIKYYEEKHMEARFGNKFHTVYYKLDSRNMKKLRDFVDHVRMAIVEAFARDPERNAWIEHPLKQFRDHKGKPKYSVIDIVEDMWSQITNGRDPTQAMYGRWTRLFDETEFNLEFESQTLKDPHPEPALDLPWFTEADNEKG